MSWFARIEHKLDHLLCLLPEGFSIAMSKLADIVSQIDTATTAIADAITAEAQAVGSVSTEVATLREQLLASPTVTQATLDQLVSIQSRLSEAQGKILSQTTTLTAIGSDPANPVPAPAPTPDPTV